MGYKRINTMYFLADEESDLATLPKAQMGAECYVISNAIEYKCNSQGEWIPQIKEGGKVDMSKYATKEYVEERVPGWEELGE